MRYDKDESIISPKIREHGYRNNNSKKENKEKKWFVLGLTDGGCCH